MATDSERDRIKDAARELLRISATGIEVSEKVVEWCHFVLTPIGRKRFKPSPNQTAVRKLLAAVDVPFDGYTARDIAKLTGLPQKITNSTLNYMLKTGRAAAVNIPKKSRYFENQAAADLGMPLVIGAEENRKQMLWFKTREAASSARTAKRAAASEKKAKEAEEKKRLRAAKPPKPVVPKAIKQALPKPHQKLHVRPNVVIHGPAKQAMNQSVFLPRPLPPVQVLPSGRDTRYTVDANAEGAGFSSEWARLRAPKE